MSLMKHRLPDHHLHWCMREEERHKKRCSLTTDEARVLPDSTVMLYMRRNK